MDIAFGRNLPKGIISMDEDDIKILVIGDWEQLLSENVAKCAFWQVLGFSYLLHEEKCFV